MQYTKLNFSDYLFGSCEDKILSHLSSSVLYTGSGRASLRIILEHLTLKGILNNKNDQVLVPRWLCQSVLYTMHRFCFPTTSLNKDVKGVLVYHQYGYPQNMDEICSYCRKNNLFIIEDCANVYDSTYKGKYLGTFGLGAIFSLSKLFPSIYGGALATNDSELYEFGKTRLEKSSRSLPYLTYGSRLLYECFKDSTFENQVSGFQEMVHALADSSFRIKNISLRVINKQLANGAMEKRRENYHFLLDYFHDKPECFSHLEREGVTPYVVPLFSNEENLKTIKKKLDEQKIVTDIYHFDVNRNVLNPNFKKCLWVPIHQDMDGSTLKLTCDMIRRNL